MTPTDPTAVSDRDSTHPDSTSPDGTGDTAAPPSRTATPAPSATTTSPRRTRGLAVGALRVALTLGTAAGMVAGAAAYPGVVDATHEGPAGSAPGAVPVTAASLTCPGAPLTGLQGAPDLATPGSVVAATAPLEALAATRPESTGTLRVAGQQDSLSTTRGSVVSGPLSTGADPVQVEASGGLAPGLAATEEWLSDRGDLRGLATVGCAPPTAEAWLTAGAGAAGRQERLVLTNPGANVVTADVTVLGRKGPVESALGSGIVVPARGRAAVLLDAIAPGEWSPVVHVSAQGGAVTATLTETWLDGATPAGAETVSPLAAPAARQVVPVTAVDGVAVLRMAVPGDQDAVAGIRLLGADGPRPLPGLNVVDVAAGSVVDLAVTGIPAGRYAVEVRADAPVLASTTIAARAGSGRGDVAWTPSSAPLPRDGTPAGLVLARGPGGVEVSRTLTLVGSQAPVEATVVRVAGGQVASELVRLPADTTRSVDLGDADAVWVRRSGGSGELRGAVDSSVGTGPTRLVSSAVLVPALVTSTVGAAVPVP